MSDLARQPYGESFETSCDESGYEAEKVVGGTTRPYVDACSIRGDDRSWSRLEPGWSARPTTTRGLR